MRYYIHVEGGLFNHNISNEFDLNDKSKRELFLSRDDYGGNPGWTKGKNKRMEFNNLPEAISMFGKVVDVILADFEYNPYTDELTRDKRRVVFSYRSGIFLSRITFTIEEE